MIVYSCFYTIGNWCCILFLYCIPLSKEHGVQTNVIVNEISTGLYLVNLYVFIFLDL